MAGRSNWYSDHPPACTCARCNEGRMNNPNRGAESLRRRRRRASRSGPGDWRPARRRNRGRSGCGGMLLIVILIGIVGGTALAAFFLGDETRRAEVSEWLISQLGSTPTPAPVVVYAADTPMPTVTPTPPVPTTVALAPTATPTPQPTPSPTVEPTATAIPIPTSVPLPEYSIDDVGVKLAAISDGVFNVDLSVSFRNVSAGAGRGPVELLMSVDGGEPELIAVIPSLATGESETFVFSKELHTGRYKKSAQSSPNTRFSTELRRRILIAADL